MDLSTHPPRGGIRMRRRPPTRMPLTPTAAAAGKLPLFPSLLRVEEVSQQTLNGAPSYKGAFKGIQVNVHLKLYVEPKSDLS